MKQNTNKIMGVTTGILLFITFIVLYWTHVTVPVMMDDLWYSTNLSTGEPLTSVKDVFESQVWHYNNWGGRSITHTILQFTLLGGAKVADILNVIVTAALYAMVIVVGKQKNIYAFFGVSVMAISLNANWKMSMFWQSGAANYLYITVFILFYLYCFLRELEGEKSFPLITLWMIPLGVIAGWSTENMGPAAWLTSLIIIVMVYREKKKIKPWMMIGNLMALAGSIVMIIAPGNFVRSAEIEKYKFLRTIFIRMHGVSKATFEYLFPVLLVLVFVLILRKLWVESPMKKRDVLLLLCALFSVGAMVLSPHYPDRATFGTMILIICVIISVAGEVVTEKREILPLLWGMCTFLWLREMFVFMEYISIQHNLL